MRSVTLVSKFLADNWCKRAIQQRSVTSADGQVTVNGSPNIARKKNQRRRPVTNLQGILPCKSIRIARNNYVN